MLGIGKEVAKQLGLIGADIAICGRRLQPLIDTANEFKKLNITVHYKQCDIRKIDSVIEFVDFVLKQCNHIDVCSTQISIFHMRWATHLFELINRSSLIMLEVNFLFWLNF